MRGFFVLLFALLAYSSLSFATTANDYTKPENWVCRPGRTDACSNALTATVIAADGTRTTRTYLPDPNAPIDCFYIYPTVSPQDTANSDMTLGPEERRAAKLEFARFGAVCRLFSPIYRQITLPALRGQISNEDYRLSAALAYRDVVAAWRDYLERDNHGRGVVLIGHSQGAKLLKELLAQEIDGKPEQKNLVSAILLGAEIDVPRGTMVGDSFQHVPLCQSGKQAGCVVAYSTFLASAPPGENAKFGKSQHKGSVDACVNPGLLTDEGKLDADFPAVGEAERMFGTTFVENPGLVSAKCRETAGHSFLAIYVGEGAGSRTVSAALEHLNARLDGWGLHALDVNLALGNLVELVRTQAKEWTASSHPQAQ